jgi:lysophospholipase L1-like esterase
VDSYLLAIVRSIVTDISDVIIINGGVNDISSTRLQTFSAVGKMTRFVQKYDNTNIIIVNIPHRYNLERNSTVNS